MESLERKLLECGVSFPISGLIGGEWVEGKGEERLVSDPGTGAHLATVRDATNTQVASAVVCARAAFQDWSSESVVHRQRVMALIADAISSRSELLATVESIDTGKPLVQSRVDVASAERYFRYYGECLAGFFGEVVPTSRDIQAIIHREPYGVVAHITPWNAPISQLARGVAPSIAAGNSVVVKPSEMAPLSSAMFGALVKAIVPSGLINIVLGAGESTGNDLASHEGINHITFTGSVATGVRVARASAVHVVPSNLELGGKSAAIVFPDGDLEKAATLASGALVRNSGQSCSALSRFIVHKSIVVDFSRLLVERVEKLSVGYALEGADIGPLISERQRERVLSHVRTAMEQGATLLTGSAVAPVLQGFEGGYYVEPTVLGSVSESMAIASEEVFGPVQSLLSFETEMEAVRKANGTNYGLVAAVFTSDIAVASRVAISLAAGQVHVNGYMGSAVEIPFGGWKRSGYGREKGFEALYGYTQAKAIVTHVPNGGAGSCWER